MSDTQGPDPEPRASGSVATRLPERHARFVRARSRHDGGSRLLFTVRTGDVDGDGRAGPGGADTEVRVALAGELCSASAPTLAATLGELARRPGAHVTVDLSALRLLTAAGVSVLVRARHDLASAGGGLRLVGARGVVARVLDRCEIDHEAGPD